MRWKAGLLGVCLCLLLVACSSNQKTPYPLCTLDAETILRVETFDWQYGKEAVLERPEQIRALVAALNAVTLTDTDEPFFQELEKTTGGTDLWIELEQADSTAVQIAVYGETHVLGPNGRGVCEPLDLAELRKLAGLPSPAGDAPGYPQAMK